MAGTTLQNLIDNVRYRTNMENNQFVTDAELTLYLNSSLAEMDDILIATYEDYKVNVAQAVITTPAPGSNFFTLPSDFLQLRGVDRQVNGVWMTVMPYMMQKRNMFSFPIINYTYGYLDIFYQLQGQQINIIPALNSGATYQIWYVPKYIPLVNPTDTLQPYMDAQAWCEYAVADAGIKVLQKQDLDPSILMRQKEELKARIINAAKPRDAGPPKTVQNTRYNLDWLGPGFSNNW